MLCVAGVADVVSLPQALRQMPSASASTIITPGTAAMLTISSVWPR